MSSASTYGSAGMTTADNRLLKINYLLLHVCFICEKDNGTIIYSCLKASIFCPLFPQGHECSLSSLPLLSSLLLSSSSLLCNLNRTLCVIKYLQGTAVREVWGKGISQMLSQFKRSRLLLILILSSYPFNLSESKWCRYEQSNQKRRNVESCQIDVKYSF